MPRSDSEICPSRSVDRCAELPSYAPGRKIAARTRPAPQLMRSAIAESEGSARTAKVREPTCRQCGACVHSWHLPCSASSWPRRSPSRPRPSPWTRRPIGRRRPGRRRLRDRGERLHAARRPSWRRTPYPAPTSIVAARGHVPALADGGQRGRRPHRRPRRHRRPDRTGAGSDQTIIDGFGADRIFDVLGPGGLALVDLTLRRGSARAATAAPSATRVRAGSSDERQARAEPRRDRCRHPSCRRSAHRHRVHLRRQRGGLCGRRHLQDRRGGAGGRRLGVHGNLGTGGPGGAIAFDGPDPLTIADSQFTSSLGGNGGAVSVNGANGFAISNCQFTDSQSYGNGGAVSFTGPGGTTISG